MLSRALQTYCAVLLLAALVLPGNARGDPAPPPVRVFVIQPRVDLAYCDTYEHYSAHLMTLVEEHVVPNLAPDRPNLLVFPEHVGLPAAFIGSRGAAARTMTTVEAAYGGLFGGDTPPYLLPLVYYMTTMQGVPVGRLLNLALTDTLWRAFQQTFPTIARRTGAWVIACTDVSGRLEASQDPTELFLLSDPDHPADQVYVARDPNVYNTAFVIAPSGAIVAAKRKPYLVEMEEGLLQFAYGALADIAPVDLGFARPGIVISKDAWMPDVQDRLATFEANLYVQPEAFGGWTIFDDPLHPEDWLPDNVLQSGWSAVQKHGALRGGVIASLTGNLFDSPFDGQSAILTDAVPGIMERAYVGQDPRGGFLAVAPWVVPDPGIADPSLSLQTRRDLLRQVGFSLLPGFPNANGYVETVRCADLGLSAPFPITPGGRRGYLGASAPLAPASRGEQKRAAAASDGAGFVVAVWEDTRDGRPQIYAASSLNGGATFTQACRVSASPHAQRAPAVVVTPCSTYVAWQEEEDGGRRIVTARASGRNRAFMRTAGLTPSTSADEWQPSLAWAWYGVGHARKAQVYLAFVQTMGVGERIVVARSTDGAPGWQTRAIEPAPALYNPRNNQWSPSIAARNGEVAVAWVDFRNYSWDVFLARSTDGGQSFTPPLRIDDAPADWERLHNDTALLYAADGALVCGWSDIRKRQAATQARIARGTDLFAASRPLSGGAASGAVSWRPRMAAFDDDMLAAVWQDFRTQGNDVYLAVSRDGGATFPFKRRIDDGGNGASYQFAPQATAVGPHRLLVLWEDTRTGRPAIRYVVGPIVRHRTP